jgi:hypothetical protein
METFTMNTRLIDILLLEIIDAYEPANANASREERLAQAKQALFGVKQDVGREPINDDKAMLAMARAALEDNAPTLAYELIAARARLKGETYDSEVPPSPKLQSLRALAMAATKDPKTPKLSRHSDEAAYRRLKRKVANGDYTLGDLLQIEEIEDRTSPELEVVGTILGLLQTLGVKVGRNGAN